MLGYRVLMNWQETYAISGDSRPPSSVPTLSFACPVLLFFSFPWLWLGLQILPMRWPFPTQFYSWVSQSGDDPSASFIFVRVLLQWDGKKGGFRVQLLYAAWVPQISSERASCEYKKSRWSKFNVSCSVLVNHNENLRLGTQSLKYSDCKIQL